MDIDGFFGEYRFLSNFYPSPIKFEHPRYAGLTKAPTVEHAFQASKTLDCLWIPRILTAERPGEAKFLGREVPAREDWEELKDGIMAELVVRKFMQNVVLRSRLLNTGSVFLIEGNNWHDNHFGFCHCKRCANIEHENMLGHILMEVRRHCRKLHL